MVWGMNQFIFWLKKIYKMFNRSCECFVNRIKLFIWRKCTNRAPECNVISIENIGLYSIHSLCSIWFWQYFRKCVNMSMDWLGTSYVFNGHSVISFIHDFCDLTYYKNWLKKRILELVPIIPNTRFYLSCFVIRY